MHAPDPVTAAEDPRARAQLQRWLLAKSAEKRIEWGLNTLSGAHVLTSSFGAQSAVSLHMLNQACPGIPVIVIDTGYLFPETYRFIDELSERLRLNLKVFRAQLSPAWIEARHGRLWEQGSEGIARYNQLVKVAPLQKALDELGARTWFSGLRRSQASSRSELPVLDLRWQRWKLHPILDWSDRDVGAYLKRHDLPWHPLWHEGYVSIGDHHTSHRWQPGMDLDDTRFFGLRRECGIHLDAA